VIAHPRGDLHAAGALATLGGPALYLLGVIACAARVGTGPSRARVAVTILLVALIPAGAAVSGLAAAAVVVALLCALVVAEEVLERRLSARA
jgi:low temperature requirement protein LtrA